MIDFARCDLARLGITRAVLIMGIFSEKRAVPRRALLVLQLLPGFRLPFPRQALGFGDLESGHFLCQFVSRQSVVVPCSFSLVREVAKLIHS